MIRRRDEYVLPRGARPFLLGHPEAVRILRFMLECEECFTSPEIRAGLGYDSSYNINKDLQQLKWHSIIEKDAGAVGDGAVRWKVVFMYRDALMRFLEEIEG